MTHREKLRLAAKAMGLDLGVWRDEFDAFVCPSGRGYWNPAHNQADSDLMACKLLISTLLQSDFVYCLRYGHGSSTIAHNNTDEDLCRAVREARLAVAVTIGGNTKC
jgi:hypothetical protein